MRHETGLMRPDHLGQIARVALVVPPGVYLASLGAFIDSAVAARDYVRRQYGAIDVLPAADRFDVAQVSLLGVSPDRHVVAGDIPIPLAGEAKGATRYDIVILIDHAVDEEMPLPSSDGLCAWLREQHADGAIIAASGAGVALLALSGLLDRRRATGPWWMSDHLQERHPNVAFDFGRHMTEDQRLYCSSGSGADAVMAIRIMETVTSHNMAQWLERRLLGKGTAEQCEAGPSADDPLLERAEYWLSEHFSRPVRVKHLAAAMKVSRRTLVRHFTAGAGVSPITYLQMLRIEAAKNMLERSPFAIDRIAGLVGYSDVSFFRRAFRRITGYSPQAWRREHKTHTTS